MKWRPKLVAILFDLFLSVYFGLLILWLILIVGVPYGIRNLLLLFVPATLLIFFLSIFVHEIGHLVAAFLLGLKISLFAVWPFVVVRVRKRFHLRFFNSELSMLGAVGALPKNVNSLAWKRGLYICAGPTVNLVVAIGSLVLAYALNESQYGSWGQGPRSFWNRLMIPRSAPAMLLYMTSALNLFHFIASLRPLPIKNFNTDGAALLALIRNPPLGHFLTRPSGKRTL
jgi:Peptidase family M50